MKNIELLPKWYKHSRRQQFGYRVQYGVLGCILVLMVGWNFSGVYSISRASAELIELESKLSDSEAISQEFSNIESQITELDKKADSLKKIDSRIDLPSVLAEISFLIDKRIVLSEVRFDAESFGDGKGGSSLGVRRARGSYNKSKTPLGNVRFRILIRGVAAEASDVADFICKLEDSAYFSQIIPSFSRNSRVRTASDIFGSDSVASEFEIGCYLANYRQQEINETSDKSAER